jgi:predicted MFS family arabinose efflux permease
MKTSTPDQSGPSSSLTGWSKVLLIALAAAVGHAFGRFSYGVLLPAVRDDMGISNTLAGSIGAANVGAYLLGTIIVAWATSHYRLVNVMRLGLGLVTLGLLIASLARGPLMLASGLFLTGMGGAFLWIPSPVIAADALPNDRRHLAVGWLGSGVGLGVMFASILSGVLRSSSGDESWSSVYQIQFFVGLVLLLLVLISIRHQQAAPSGGAGLGGFSALQRMPGWLPLILAYATFGFINLLVIGFFTSRLEDDSGWSTSDAAFAFSIMGLAMIFGGPIFAAVANRFGLRRVLATSFGLWPIFLGIVMTGYELPVLIACAGLGLLFSAFPILITLYVVQNTTPEDYGPSFSAATLAFGVTQIISPPVGGLIADLTGSFTLVFILAGFMGLLGVMATLRLPIDVNDPGN